MSITVILLIVALVLFVIATFGVAGRINLLAAGLACCVLAALLGGGHVLALTSYQLTAGFVPLTASASPAMDPQAFNMMVALCVGAASSYVLKYAPANWKGKPMAIAAVAFSIILEVAELYVTGQLNHFNIADAASIVAAIAGQQFFFAMLKDNLQLQDPPAATPAPPASLGSPQSVK